MPLFDFFFYVTQCLKGEYFLNRCSSVAKSLQHSLTMFKLVLFKLAKISIIIIIKVFILTCSSTGLVKRFLPNSWFSLRIKILRTDHMSDSYYLKVILLFVFWNKNDVLLWFKAIKEAFKAFLTILEVETRFKVK